MSLLRRLTNLWRRERLDADIEDELRAHLELAAEDAERAGLSPEAARRAARLRFGHPLAVRERTAEVDTAPVLEEMLRDWRHAVRQLRRSPAFTATAVVTLALGIGATTAVFTLVEQVMLRPLPVVRPDQLWRIGDTVGCCNATGYAQNNWSFFSREAHQHFRANTPAFEELAAFQVGQAQLVVRRAGSPAPAEARAGEYVSGNFFGTLGITAWRGRLFTDADDRAGAPPVAVMSFNAWHEKYGSDPSVIGATYDINGHSFAVIGIAPPGFFGAKIAPQGTPGFWLPLATEPLIAGATSRLDNPRVAWLDLIGRVSPGTDPKALEVRLQTELHQWLASHVPDMTSQEKAVQAQQTLHLAPGGGGVSLMRETYHDGLRLLLVAAICVLLVASANIANLLLARGLKDRHQAALRAALGASRARLLRKALVESLTLSVLGAAAGIAVAYGGASLILHLAFAGTDRWVPVDAAPSMPVLLFALALSAVTAVVFGIAPAWKTARTDAIDALHGANRTVGGHRGWGQKSLVVVQAALSLVLLSVAAMLGQSLRNLEHQDFGFETSGRYLVTIDPRTSGYQQEQLVPLFYTLENRLRSIGGVRMVSPALYAPLGNLYWSHDVRIDGKPEPGPADDVSSAWTRVTPGFFETLGGRIVMGRPITGEDNATTRRVAVVNEAFVKRHFGAESPLGRHFGPAPQKNAALYEIVGVAADMRYFGSPDVQPMYFVPFAQGTHFEQADLEGREVWSHYLYNIVIWAPASPPDLGVQVKQALADVAPNLVMYRVQPYSEIIQTRFAQQNMIASLAWAFGSVGLVLAAVGLYGVTAYGVGQRTGEIGVRMALGAERGSVVAMVLRGAFWQVGIGLAFGIPAAIGAAYLIGSNLFGVRPWDPVMLSGATLLLGLAALTAAFIPARRAASVSPMQALRAE